MSESSFFRFEWLDGEGMRGPELAATFARLEIWIDGLCTTRVHDRRTRTVRDAIFVPLYPIAEWAAEHYWRLLNEPANRAGSPGFDAAHDLASADHGYALPRLEIYPEGGHARILVQPRRVEHFPVELIAEGERRVAHEDLQRALWDLMLAADERLAATGAVTTRFHDLLARRKDEEADPEMAEFCRLVAALGLAPDSVPDEVADAVEQAGKRLPIETLEDVCASIEPSTLRGGTAWVETTRQRLERIEPESPDAARRFAEELVAAARDAGRQRAGPPWRWGYAIANRVGELVGATDPEGSSLERLLAGLGIADRVAEVERIDGIAALTLAGKSGTPRLAVTPRTEPGRRFAIARGLFDFIVTGAPVPRLATRALDERQRAGRAFAAQLLAPAEAIAPKLPADRLLQAEDLEELAAAFRVSTEVIRHQVENHGLARIAG